MTDVRVWEEEITIPTYEIGEADHNPMFLEKRVYQGSSGKVYPYPTVEKISKSKTNKIYKAVFLENEYLKIMVLPELGGRIQRAYDKTNDYDFVYYNQVIKPALVGLTGPWISGGIEFNWPQHHRPATFLPVDFTIQDNENGSMTLLLHDVDLMYGTQCLVKLTLHPGKAYLEIKGQLYNGTSLPQTFLWWANPAVSVNDYTRTIFPTDVHMVYDHGKRDVSKFPIADGVYYKHDYSAGVDISRYKNVPVPTSYMAEKSEYDFVGGYDDSVEAGVLHVADHHISPGKKQWTWGCDAFGKAWDRNLTDEDGPYIELMTGIFTDNQPDFTWLFPFEEKNFVQYFMPYKKLGAVKNASKDCAINMEVEEDGIHVLVYGTALYEEATVRVCLDEETIFSQVVKLSPRDVFETKIPIKNVEKSRLLIQVLAEGKELISFQEKDSLADAIAQPMKPAKDPSDIEHIEELYLTGQHLEQYRHATYLPDPYYLEGLKRDDKDSRINQAYGQLLLRRGCFEEAKGYFQKAISRITWKNPNPYNSEAYYSLGLALFYQEQYEEAFDQFYKATWSHDQQEMSFYYLAVLATRKGSYEEALAFIEQSLIKNTHNIKARSLKVLILRKLSKEVEAISFIEENLKVDPFDYVSRMEWYFLDGDMAHVEELKKLSREFFETYLQIARQYGEVASYEEALFVLSLCKEERPLCLYYQGYYLCKTEAIENGLEAYQKAEHAPSRYCFPNHLQDIAVLQDACASSAENSKAAYYLGNLYYDKLQVEKAIAYWEQSIAKNQSFPTVYRNLALVYYNKKMQPTKARDMLEKAFSLDETDGRVLFELDQLYKKMGVAHQTRMEKLAAYPSLIEERDDLYIEWVTLHNMVGAYETAYQLIQSHWFGPWEGAEGKITAQYKIALVEMGKARLKEMKFDEAKELLEKALVYPENLGEGKLEGTKDNDIWYYIGVATLGAGEAGAAISCFEKATDGDGEVAAAMFYNDQPADMIYYQGLAQCKLEKEALAKEKFNTMYVYGMEHVEDEVRIDYFAVSLPDFLVFEENLKQKNTAHCHYLMGLSNLGNECYNEAIKEFELALKEDCNHQNALRYLELAKEEKQGGKI